MGASSQEAYTEDFVRQEKQTTIWIGKDDYKGDIHSSIISAISELDKEEITEIFGIKEPNRILSEDYQIQDDLRVEDFAITGSYNGGEIAVGQMVSSNGKKKIGSVPKDFIQARAFGYRINQYPNLDVEPEGLYVVRTEYPPEKVDKRNKRLRKDINFFGSADIRVDIFEVEPMEENLGESVDSFYSSLTQS